MIEVFRVCCGVYKVDAGVREWCKYAMHMLNKKR